MFDDFMSFAGYRESQVQDKVEECMNAIYSGETDIHFDRGDLTDSEVQQVFDEVRRRVE